MLYRREAADNSVISKDGGSIISVLLTGALSAHKENSDRDAVINRVSSRYRPGLPMDSSVDKVA
jgi:hypothetical protein